MKPLSKLQSMIFMVGGLLMAVGAGGRVFLWHPAIFSWIFLVGAIAFVAMQAQQKYEGSNPTIKRLRKIMLTSGVFFILAGLLMVDNCYLFLTGVVPYLTYVTYFYNKWVMLLLVGAVLQLYSIHRISNELQKD